MYNKLADIDIDPQSINQMQLVMSTALRLILEEKPLDEFLDWARTSIPIIAPLMFRNFSDEEQPRMAYWMGINLWSSAPQPGNHFKPDPLTKTQSEFGLPLWFWTKIQTVLRPFARTQTTPP